MARKKKYPVEHMEGVIVDPNTAEGKFTKRRDSEHYKECHIERLIDQMTRWTDDHPESKEIQDFVHAHNIPLRTYYDLLHRFPALQEAHDTLKDKLGGRLWSRAVDNKSNWLATKFMLHTYADRFKDAKEYDASLTAKSKEIEQPTVFNVTIPAIPDSPVKKDK